MKKLLMMTLLLGLISCGKNSESKKSELRFFKVQGDDFSQYINQKAMPETPNLQEDKSIINNDYPIEISLYKDGKWYYNLPNLDDGHGTWKYEGGTIKLHASRILFDMNISIEAIEEGADEVAIRFSDRFGPKVLAMEKSNIFE
ncbi:hypothetical protein [Bacteriovorax sp. DB6_IX]|uniref:hypothetical protein n=1 Tax=Bacteriovorax sp. DB6_IX TaxID=1353530 RepID=UPI0006A733BC|nr:hypothetical protein [Bacteriovorax sp. DB6_IX]